MEHFGEDTAVNTRFLTREERSRAATAWIDYHAIFFRG
jgi:hypothetical protein